MHNLHPLRGPTTIINIAIRHRLSTISQALQQTPQKRLRDRLIVSYVLVEDAMQVAVRTPLDVHPHGLVFGIDEIAIVALAQTSGVT